MCILLTIGISYVSEGYSLNISSIENLNSISSKIKSTGILARRINFTEESYLKFQVTIEIYFFIYYDCVEFPRKKDY